MKVQKLSLIFFKNHTDWSWEGDEDVIGIYGLNGVGKTSILDAVHFLCLGKSYFSSTDVQCIQYEQPQAGIISTIISEDTAGLKIKFNRGSRKIVSINDVNYKRIAKHIGKYLAVVIAPGDIELVYGTNEKRRSFVNQILSQVERAHLDDLVVYNKLIEHRNKHLKTDDVDHALIQTLDIQIAPLAEKIYLKRKSFLEKFSVVFSNFYYRLSGEKEDVSLSYKSQLEESSYLELVEKCRMKDIAVQRSFAGIHKDELDIEIGGYSLKKFGSQGQIKSALIALKLAEFEYLSESTGKKPVLLLDDIFEKIDQERAEVLTQIIKNDTFGQIFVTDTDQQRLERFCKQINKPHITLELK